MGATIGANVTTCDGCEAWRRGPAEAFSRLDEADRACLEAEFATAALGPVAIRPPRHPARGVGPRRGARTLASREVRRMSGRAINLALHCGEPRVITANVGFALRRGI